MNDRSDAPNDGGPADDASRVPVKPDYAGPATSKAEAEAAPRRGFFTIYKQGQGYWTRMGTAIGAALLVGLTAWQIYENRPILGLENRPQLAIGIAVAFFAVGAFFAWRMMNKPQNADFLIATDSEMKKVNWTSRKELIGSTKVVIVFMFMIAFFLFAIDIVFGYFFYMINVLKSSPFGAGGTVGGG